MAYNNKGGASNAVKYFNDQYDDRLKQFQKGGGNKTFDVKQKKNKITIKTRTESKPDSTGSIKVEERKDVVKKSGKGYQKKKTYTLKKS